jgi:RNA recognition motif-containing protein
MTIHFWTEEEIEHVRKLLPKIANGRKTRYKKKQSAGSKQQSAKKHSAKKHSAVSTQQSAKARKKKR